MKPLKIGAYLRVSTDRQVQVFEGSLETQKYRMQEFVKNRNRENKGWGEIIEFYVDEGLSAGTDKRPQYQRLMADIRSGKINLIFVADISRLSRSVHDFSVLLRELDRCNASYLSMKEQFDTTTPAGRLMINMVVNMAQFEREQTSERVSINCNSRAVRGYVNGGRTPLGYDRDKEKSGLFVINEKEAKDVRTIFEVFIEQGSVGKTIPIIEALGIFPKASGGDSEKNETRSWNVTPLKEVLSSVTYVGLKEVNKKHQNKNPETLKPWQHYQVVKAAWPAIVDEMVFNDAQAILQENMKLERRRIEGAEKRIFLLSGILRCGECGRPLSGHSNHGKTHVHRYYAHAEKRGKESICSFKRIRADELEQVVIDHLTEAAGRASYFDEIERKLTHAMKDAPAQIDGEILRVRELLAETEREVTSTFQLQVRGGGGSEAAGLATEHLEKLGKTKRILGTRLLELEDLKISQQDAAAIRGFIEHKVREFKKGFHKSTPATKRRLLRRVLEKLVFKGNGLETYFKFDEARAETAVQAFEIPEMGKILKFAGKKPAGTPVSGPDSGLNLSFENLRVVGIGWLGDENTNQSSSTFHLVDFIQFRTCGPLLSKEFLHQKYVIERLSMGQIAQLVISSTSSVHKYLKLYGLPIRKGHECHLPTKGYGLAYGKRVENRQIIAHKREQEVIAKMKELRAKGFSYPKIADALNTMGIPTKTGRAKWCAKKVQQIIG